MKHLKTYRNKFEEANTIFKNENKGEKSKITRLFKNIKNFEGNNEIKNINYELSN